MTNSGFLLINKPQEWTSFDVVAKLRNITQIKKIGHAGTLDPFATGLLIVAIGRDATKQIDSFMGLGKEYIAEFVLGATTDSLDTETEVVVDTNMPEITHEQIDTVMKELIGDIKQIPPMHSAIKVGGQRLYKMARKGEEIERKPRPVRIEDFRLISDIEKENGQLILEVRIQCSSGTYIRALARDLAQKLNTTGYCRALRRSKIGDFNVSDALEMDQINSETWQNLVKKLEIDVIDEKGQA
ncbi:tRNA pseudouridine(55) synthase TruB [Candidatus Uhrbacteria bacterium]|nr:tRNA pseudouridine(55) synthase TruB [Candidatus Uhrbacteria bacterium]MBT7717069.1 tRNA pseudouridine(55) synthase TruB [Candidatus Uhrbacteria bacterium]